MSKVVLILGAGASIPFIKDGTNKLDTNYLTNKLKAENLWSYILNLYDKRKENIHRGVEYLDCDNISFLDIERSLDLIDKVLKHDNKISQSLERTNFEYIIHLFDRISNILWAIDDPIEINIDGLFTYYFNRKALCDLLLSNSDTDGWLIAPFLAREVIAKAIIDLWETSNKDESISNISDFFKNLDNIFDQINIYSFNYDPLIHFATKEMNFVDGFTEKGFSPKLYLKSCNTVAYLHGNIGFVPTDNNMSFSDSWENTQKRRIKGLWKGTSLYSRGMKGIHMNSFLITGLDKSEAFSRQPFSSYMFRFSRDIEQADMMFIVGSSLQDRHVLYLLLNSRYCDSRRYFVISKQETNEIVKQANPRNISEDMLLWKIIEFLDPVLGRSDESNSDFLYKNEKRIEGEMKDRGYSKVTEKSYLYINGFKEFIENFERIKSDLIK